MDNGWKDGFIYIVGWGGVGVGGGGGGGYA